MKPVSLLSDDELVALGRTGALLQAAPSAVLDRACAIWRPRSAPAGVLTRLAAVLRFDGWTAAPALRNARPRVRQLIFSAAELDVELRIEPSADASRWSLRGQLLGLPASCQVHLDGSGDTLSAPGDEFGCFAFEGVAPGTVRLTVESDGIALDLPPFDVGAPA